MYGSVAMQILLIFMTDDGLFAIHLDYAYKSSHIIAIKNYLNMTTIFFNRRQKVSKVDKKSDFPIFRCVIFRSHPWLSSHTVCKIGLRSIESSCNGLSCFSASYIASSTGTVAICMLWFLQNPCWCGYGILSIIPAILSLKILFLILYIDSSRTMV